jgi:hypothetical protein
MRAIGKVRLFLLAIIIWMFGSEVAFASEAPARTRRLQKCGIGQGAPVVSTASKRGASGSVQIGVYEACAKRSDGFWTRNRPD